MSTDEQAQEANTPEHKRQYLKLCSIVYDLQTKSRYCPFMDFSGHVNHMTIRIKKTKENYFIELIENTTINLDNFESKQNMIDKLTLLLEDDSQRY